MDAEIQLDPVPADARQWLGGTIPAVNVTGVPKVDVVDWLSSPEVPGWPLPESRHPPKGRVDGEKVVGRLA